MAYLERVNEKLTCTHPKVLKIHEWDAVRLDLNRTAYRLITINLSNGYDKVFLDYGDGNAEKEAEQWLKKLSK